MDSVSPMVILCLCSHTAVKETALPILAGVCVNWRQQRSEISHSSNIACDLDANMEVCGLQPWL